MGKENMKVIVAYDEKEVKYYYNIVEDCFDKYVLSLEYYQTGKDINFFIKKANALMRKTKNEMNWFGKAAFDVYAPTENKKHDPVNRPSHYTDGNIEVIDFIEDKRLNFVLGNALKYICRAGKKNKDKEIEDLEKSIWYINRRIKQIKEINDNKKTN